MKIAICDDEVVERNAIANLVKNYNADFEIVMLSTSQDLLDVIQNEYFDLVLLDIEMESPNGYETAKILKKLKDPPCVVFVTKSNAYTIRGYEVAFRYLRKPIKPEAFFHVMDAVCEELKPQHLTIQTSGGITVFSLQDILYIESNNYNVCIHTMTGTYTVRKSLKAITTELALCCFARPHNSFLVNLQKIRSATSKTLTLVDSTQIPISRNNRDSFEKKFMDYLRR